MYRSLYRLLSLATILGSLAVPASSQVLFQQFYYPIEKPPAGTSWWKQAGGELASLARLGVYAVWHPVPTKGGSGPVSMGYDPYDLYDLGSKDQRGTIPTNFGTKDEYLGYVAAAHANGIRVYADVVLNHTGGADSAQENPVMARLGWDNIQDDMKVPPAYRPSDFDPAKMNLRSWTLYTPKGADGKPGTGRFSRTWKHFHPSETHPDHKEPYHKPEFGEDYCYEADGGYVGQELCSWGEWFQAQTGIDGMRLDAVKLVDPPFLAEFSARVTKSTASTGAPFFLVGEFWDTNHQLLNDFQTATGNRMSLFDFGLFYALWDMTEKPATFDMRDILKRRFPDRNRSVSFVSNHDIDRFQPIKRDKRALPYAITMTMSGQPSVFYLDYFKPEDKQLPKVLEALIPVHNRFAVGKENIRFSDADVLVIEREKNLIGFFNDGGSGERKVTVETAFGKNVRLNEVGKPTAGGALQTDAKGLLTVTVPAGGYLLFVRADASLATNPDRFALRPFPTVQVTEFADDLDIGRIGPNPRVIRVHAAQDTELTAELFGTSGPGSGVVEIRDNDGKLLEIHSNLRGKTTVTTVKRLPATGTYRIQVSASGEPTAGKLRVRYVGVK